MPRDNMKWSGFVTEFREIRETGTLQNTDNLCIASCSIKGDIQDKGPKQLHYLERGKKERRKELPLHHAFLD